MNLMRCVVLSVTLAASMTLAGCGDGSEGGAVGTYGGGGDASVSTPVPDSTQRDALDSAWDNRYTEADQQSLCAQFAADPVGTVNTFDSFDYDIAKEWLESKC